MFALEYGSRGTGDIAASAGQLKRFVDAVLGATGARKVSLVGHSQGGMMPRYYIKFLGGAADVDDLVGLSPSNHGTTNPAAFVAGSTFCDGVRPAGGRLGLPADAQRRRRDAGSVSYTVIETHVRRGRDPYTSAFLAPGASTANILLQDACPAEVIDHHEMPNDAPRVPLDAPGARSARPADPRPRRAASSRPACPRGRVLARAPDGCAHPCRHPPRASRLEASAPFEGTRIAPGHASHPPSPLLIILDHVRSRWGFRRKDLTTSHKWMWALFVPLSLPGDRGGLLPHRPPAAVPGRLGLARGTLAPGRPDHRADPAAATGPPDRRRGQPRPACAAARSTAARQGRRTG